jgi:hypothetical protein
MVYWFGGRESIFCFSHTNEFCGTHLLATEPAVACNAAKAARRPREGGGARGPLPAAVWAARLDLVRVQLHQGNRGHRAPSLAPVPYPVGGWVGHRLAQLPVTAPVRPEGLPGYLATRRARRRIGCELPRTRPLTACGGRHGYWGSSVGQHSNGWWRWARRAEVG